MRHATQQLRGRSTARLPDQELQLACSSHVCVQGTSCPGTFTFYIVVWLGSVMANPPVNDDVLARQLKTAMETVLRPLQDEMAALRQQQAAQIAATQRNMVGVVRRAGVAARAPDSDPPPVRCLSWLSDAQVASAAAPAEPRRDC